MQKCFKFTEVWLIMWFITSTLILYHTHTKHTWVNRLTHSDKYILTSPVMCSQQLSLLHWIICWYQKFTLQNEFTMSLLFKYYSPVEVTYMLNKTNFFTWHTKNTNSNGINKQNTHTHTHTHIHSKHSQKDNIGKG